MQENSNPSGLDKPHEGGGGYGDRDKFDNKDADKTEPDTGKPSDKDKAGEEK